MVDRFVHGLLFGTGFGIALVILLTLCWLVLSPLGGLRIAVEHNAVEHNGVEHSQELIDGQDILNESDKMDTHEEGTGQLAAENGTGFLGRMKIFSGGSSRDDFANKNTAKGVVSGGPGLIIGNIIANDQPVSGLKIRLILNREITSKWVTTNHEGAYELNVPYGEYRIDGYELDTLTANKLLSGMIDHPQIVPLTGTIFEVRQGLNARGPTFRFTNPVNKNVNKSRYSLTEDIVINWEPYPGAKLYTVQVYEKRDPLQSMDQKEMFSRSSRPSMTDTYINLKSHQVNFKPGHFYTVEIVARNERINIISKTADPGNGYDFEIIP
ncbi:MAG: carboxypeptidase-like regulatory domain-containing protein [Gammaproteobacteria bacterium]|nr:carboxypeptidase-like regulatory domain-containing protein [Gammaproteobacteria bacterium]